MPTQSNQRQQKVESAIKHQSASRQTGIDRHRVARRAKEMIRRNRKRYATERRLAEMTAGHITQAQLICEGNVRDVRRVNGRLVPL
jgi:acyl-CoA reductase-like NAD-dependent aldehyde dehydrogenase